MEFKDFIILNYSINFFKSIKYINIYKIYPEFNEIYNIIKENNNVDAKTYVQLLDDKYIKNNEDYKIRMINYHNYISQITGIKCGLCLNVEVKSFCNILYKHFLFFKTYNINNNIFNDFFEENILRKALLIYLKNEIDNNNNINTILNLILLLIQLIHDKDISKELMQLMNIKIGKESNKKFKENNNDFLNKENIIKNNIKNNQEYSDSINKSDYYNLNTDIVNNNQYLLINNKKLFFKELIFDNYFFSTIKSDFILINNNNNELIITIINFIFSIKYNLKNTHIIICFNIIENLISDNIQINNNQYSNQILNILGFYYLETLKQIKDILFENNNDLNNGICKYSYNLFEECFNLN